MQARSKKDAGQATIEAAIVVPALILLILAVFDYGIRMENQARAAMAVRYAAWLGVHDRWDKMEDLTYQAFFPLLAPKKNSGDQGGGGDQGQGQGGDFGQPGLLGAYSGSDEEEGGSGEGEGGDKDKKKPWYAFSLKKEHKDLSDMQSEGGVVGDVIGTLGDILPSDLFGKNVKVTGTYSQQALGYMPPMTVYGSRQWRKQKEAEEEEEEKEDPNGEGSASGEDEEKKKKQIYYSFLGPVQDEPVVAYWINENDLWSEFGLLSWLHIPTP